MQPAVPGTTLGREAPFLKYDNNNKFSKEAGAEDVIASGLLLTLQ
jgi:hypothetical protein